MHILTDAKDETPFIMNDYTIGWVYNETFFFMNEYPVWAAKKKVMSSNPKIHFRKNPLK